MIYQLPSGRAIELSLEQYLDMSDAELDYMNANYYGDSIEDPWFGSVISKLPPPDEIISEEFVLQDLTSVTLEEKLINPDLDISPSDE